MRNVMSGGGSDGNRSVRWTDGTKQKITTAIIAKPNSILEFGMICL